MRSKKFLIILGILTLLAVAFWALRGPGPKIMIVTNDSAPIIGGTKMIITGSGFTTNGRTRVLIGAVEATKLEVSGRETIIVDTPPSPPGTFGVTVINPDGRRAHLADTFTYSALKPVITSITPDSGPTSGGFEVKLTGHGFKASAIRVKVDTVLVPAVVTDDSNLSFTAPPMSEAKQVNVAVISADGAWSSDSANLNYR